jgi:PucR C-terminal helix-turn-helix domain/GGDEF-like domain
VNYLIRALVADEAAYRCRMEQLPLDTADAEVAALSARILERSAELADGMAARIRDVVPVYQTGTLVSTQELLATCLDNIGFVFGPMGRSPAVSAAQSRENGRRRAKAGVPLAAVMAAYRAAASYLWDCLAQTAAAAGTSAETTLRGASQLWVAMDTFTQEMADGYRDEIAFQALTREQERSALVQALLDGNLDEPSLWEAADILRIPSRGTYVVIAAQPPAAGRRALPQAETALRAAGVISAWRLLHDIEAGIAWLPGPQPDPGRLADWLRSAGPGLAGISPCYDDLRHTARFLRLARIALRSAIHQQPVALFAGVPLATAAAADPEVMQRVADAILGPLDQIPATDRDALLGTLGTWLDHGGSADRAAAALYCHPNTVRHRLRRLEQRTGRSLSDPRGIAELTFAYEIARRREGPPGENGLGADAAGR